MKKYIYILLFFLLWIQAMSVQAIDPYFSSGSLGEMYRSMNYYYSYLGEQYLLKIDNVLVDTSFIDTNSASISLQHVNASGTVDGTKVYLLNGTDQFPAIHEIYRDLNIELSGNNAGDTILREIQQQYLNASPQEQAQVKQDTQSSLFAPTLNFTTINGKVVAYGENTLTPTDSPLVSQLKEQTSSSFTSVKPDYNLNSHMEPTYVEKDQKYYNEELNKITDYLEKYCSDANSSSFDQKKCNEMIQKAATIKEVDKETFNRYQQAVNKVEKTLEEQHKQNQQTVEIIEESTKTETEEKPNGETVSTTTVNFKSGCEAIYGGGIGEYINHLFTFVKYAGLALVVILSTMDFLKVIAADKDDALKVAFNRLVKRCIALVLLFLTPSLIRFAFNLLNITGSNGEVIDVCTSYIK